MKRSLVRLSAIVLLLGICACSRFESRFDAGYQEVNGKVLSQFSNMSDVLQALGPPTRLGRSGDGVGFIYEGLALRETQFGVSLAYDWLRLFKAVVATGDADINTMVFTFNGDEELLSFSASRETRKLGSGSSVDLIFQAVPLVDVESYTNLSPQHDWGHGLSEPLPLMLNAQNSMQNGAGGVQRQGTPTGVGQETLSPHQ